MLSTVYQDNIKGVAMPGDSDDNSDDWEFKVLRSNLNGFRNPEVMKKCLEEEARAGWVFVEKFDDARIRFKRPISSRRADAPSPRRD